MTKSLCTSLRKTQKDSTYRYWIILIPMSRVLFQTCCLREVRFVKIQPVRDIIRILHAKFLCRVRLLLQQLLYARVHILAERFLAKQETYKGSPYYADISFRFAPTLSGQEISRFRHLRIRLSYFLKPQLNLPPKILHL